MTGGWSWGGTRPPSTPVLKVISSSPRCVEPSGHEETAVHPRFMPDPRAAGFLRLEGSLLPLFWQPLLPSASAALWELKLLGCALAWSQHLLGEASCPGSLPSLGSSARFSGEALGPSCCQRAEGPSHLGGLVTLGPASLPVTSPSLKLPALETLGWAKGL